MIADAQADVAVVGAGPAGCVTALAFARQGARVLLLEAQPHNKRLAGEWLHPPGVEVLRNLGVPPIAAAAHHPPGRGFVVFPGNGSEPIVLKYPDGELGLTCEHHAFVSALRTTALDHRQVRFLPSTRVTHLEKRRLGASNLAGESRTFDADLIVGADGRSSLTRRCLGIPDERTLVSHMAGVLLEDAELPFEGFGHLFLGGPGPMFVSRIGPAHIRACIDVPVNSSRCLKNGDGLWQAYRAALPATLHAPFRRALEGQSIAWAANQWRPRVHYGREGVALVGDAVGHFHPLTAVGMTLGFLDGYALAQSKCFRDYRNQRTAASRVPELLSMGLHNLFTLQDTGTVALRNALFTMWRQSPTECRETMRLLSGEQTNAEHFVRAFLKVVVLGLQQVFKDTLGSWHFRHLADSLKSFARWLGWLAAGTVR